MGWITDTLSAVGDFATSEGGSELISSGIEFGANWLGQQQAQEANEQALQQYREGAEDAAQTITEGAEEAANRRLEGINDIRNLTEEQFNRLKDYYPELADAYAKQARGASEDFGQTVTGAADAYGGDLQQAGGQYGRRVTGAAGAYGGQTQAAGAEYGGRMRRAAGDYAGIMGAGRRGATAMYRPYAKAGGQGLRGLQRIAAQDPSKLSPSQQDQLEDYRRGARARLSSSGLRGAGRAGVAAVNEGEAEMRTSMQARNEDERRQTLQALSDLGYGASGQIAGLRMNTAQDVAGTYMNTASNIAGENLRLDEQGMQALLSARENAAGESLRLDEKAAGADYDAMTTAADQELQTENAIAQQDLRTGQQVADLTSGYYESMADLAGQEAETEAGAIETGTSAKAAAESNPAYIQAQAGLSNARNRQATYGQLGSIVADAIKEQAAGAQNDPSFYG